MGYIIYCIGTERYVKYCLEVFVVDIVVIVSNIFYVCFCLGYCLQIFCDFITVVIWKLGKLDYTDLKVWRLIFLLKMLVKVFEFVIIYLFYLAKIYWLLLDIYVGG